MDGVLSGLTFLLGFALRLAVPLLATLALAWALRQLDRRWQREAVQVDESQAFGPTSVIRCWLLNDCPPAKREQCEAYQDRKVPCWQHFRGQRGALQECCLDCPVFRRAPALELA